MNYYNLPRSYDALQRGPSQSWFHLCHASKRHMAWQHHTSFFNMSGCIISPLSSCFLWQFLPQKEVSYGYGAHSGAPILGGGHPSTDTFDDSARLSRHMNAKKKQKLAMLREIGHAKCSLHQVNIFVTCK